MVQRQFSLTEYKCKRRNDSKTTSNPCSPDLPTRLKSKNIAAQITKKSLELYDQSNIDEIGLHAVEVGGYAWASYGYGWDEDKMVELKYRNQLNVQAIKNIDQEVKAAHPKDRPSELQTLIQHERNQRLQATKTRTEQETPYLSSETRAALIEQTNILKTRDKVLNKFYPNLIFSMIKARLRKPSSKKSSTSFVQPKKILLLSRHNLSLALANKAPSFDEEHQINGIPKINSNKPLQMEQKPAKQKITKGLFILEKSLFCFMSGMEK